MNKMKRVKELKTKERNRVESKKVLHKVAKNVQGITLIALVVTIIVLLILAGIALNLTIGQGGIFSRAEIAANTWRNAETNEQTALGELANWIDDSIPKPPEPISETEAYIGCYADVDGNGSVDGVIFADLAVAKSGQWNGDSWSGYSYEAGTNLKQYTISGEYGTDGEGFGKNSVIAPIKGSGENDRFYVMALEDIPKPENSDKYTEDDEAYYCWYDATYGKLEGPFPATGDNDFGAGRENTEKVNAKWNDPNLPWGAHNDNANYDDMWSVIQDEIEAGWFVPSKSEWSAFGDAFDISSSSSDPTYYVNYGLSGWYWSSSQHTTYNAYRAFFSSGYIGSGGVDSNFYVRLATTF